MLVKSWKEPKWNLFSEDYFGFCSPLSETYDETLYSCDIYNDLESIQNLPQDCINKINNLFYKKPKLKLPIIINFFINENIYKINFTHDYKNYTIFYLENVFIHFLKTANYDSLYWEINENPEGLSETLTFLKLKYA